MEWLTIDFLSPAKAGIVDFSTYLLGTIFIILLPGPNSLYVLAVSTQKGWRFGAWGALGIFIGDSVLMIAIALGAASLLMSSPLLFGIVQTIGAIYLAWMGWGLFRNGIKRWHRALHEESDETLQAKLMQFHPLVAALTLSLTNPKAIFFFIAFFSQFIRPDFENPAYTFSYLAIVLQFMSMSYLACLIFVGQLFLKFFQRQPRLGAALWMLAGVLFIGFAGRLLVY